MTRGKKETVIARNVAPKGQVTKQSEKEGLPEETIIAKIAG
jgi:hypothetical protein